MRLQELYLKNFRCFDAKTLSFHHDSTLIYGHNGSGKTSILEAIYYICYLHSFRTHNTRELIRFDEQDFFIQACVQEQDTQHAIQVGFSDKKRVVRIDKKAVRSYKELMSLYRVISITEDDIELVRGEPELRRTFLDQTCLLVYPDMVQSLRTYRTIVTNRNKLLLTGKHDQLELRLWTEQLWQQAVLIQQQRERMLVELNHMIAQLGHEFFGEDFSLEMVYCPKARLGDTVAQFLDANRALFEQEQRYGRSLFGPHLDDVSILFQHKKSRIFASRGQQKCSVTLLKLAQLLLIRQTRGQAIVVLDDFMTDFDSTHVRTLLTMLAAQGAQLIFTVPTNDSPLVDSLKERGASEIVISD